MHLQIQTEGYSTSVHGISRAAAHQLITQISERTELPIKVRLEPETVAERYEQARGEYSEGYEVRR